MLLAVLLISAPIAVHGFSAKLDSGTTVRVLGVSDGKKHYWAADGGPADAKAIQLMVATLQDTTVPHAFRKEPAATVYFVASGRLRQSIDLDVVMPKMPPVRGASGLELVFGTEWYTWGQGITGSGAATSSVSGSIGDRPTASIEVAVCDAKYKAIAECERRGKGFKTTFGAPMEPKVRVEPTGAPNGHGPVTHTIITVKGPPIDDRQVKHKLVALDAHDRILSESFDSVLYLPDFGPVPTLARIKRLVYATRPITRLTFEGIHLWPNRAAQKQ